MCRMVAKDATGQKRELAKVGLVVEGSTQRIDIVNHPLGTQFHGEIPDTWRKPTRSQSSPALASCFPVFWRKRSTKSTSTKTLPERFSCQSAKQAGNLCCHLKHYVDF